MVMYAETEEDLLEMLAFVGISAIDVPGKFTFNVKVANTGGSGIVSFGSSSGTRARAIESAMMSIQIDWYSVREKILKKGCEDLMLT